MTWWKQSVFYEIYIRSFQDSNGDGVGDLNGVTARLDYLSDLGVDAIWLTPFYPSPQVDFGYDVADHEDVDTQFGTLADLDGLVTAAHRRGIKIVVDIVLNHTSDRHAWFEASRASRTSQLRDWYVWRDGPPGGGPPNNWESAFGGPAWTRDERTSQWYYHAFYPEQPDLNWRNPEVERRMFATVKFWIDRGVDGFRLDAANTLFEDLELRDNPTLPEPNVTLTGIRTQRHLQTRGLPEVHDVLRRLRHFVDRHDPRTVLISEAYVDSAEDLADFYGEDDDEMQLPFNFLLAQLPRLDAHGFREAVGHVERAFGNRWPSLVLSNHDIDRACDRYAPADEDRDRVGRLLTMLLLTLRGTPFLYYGEEIGMRTQPPARLDDVQDPVGRRFWPSYKGRDGVRRPMAWDTTPGGGFTNGIPWLALGADAGHANVARQRADPASMLNFCRSLLRLRRGSAALSDGTYLAVPSGRDVFAFVRQSAFEMKLVVLNMANGRHEGQRPIEPDALRGTQWRVALGTHRPSDDPVDLLRFSLSGYEALLLEPV